MVHRSINSQLFLLTLKVVISTLVLISAVYSTYFMIFYDWHSPPAFSWIHDSPNDDIIRSTLFGARQLSIVEFCQKTY